METQRTLTQIIAAANTAYVNCCNSGNKRWEDIWDEVIDAAEYELPRGSGFDHYPTLDREDSDDKRLVFTGSYHAMDEHGGYNGWRDYTIYAWPAFDGIRITVRGGGEHAEYIRDCFAEALQTKHGWNDFRADLSEEQKAA